ncbi:MAG: SU10 major capsid protein, partial [Candidatus Thorarchaeota archaeon]
GNYTQIFNKTFIISGTQEVVSKAGRKSEIGRQALRQMKELKRDVEFALTRNQAGTAGSNTVGRSLGSMESWIGATTPSATAATNVVLTTAAASGTYTEVVSGAPSAPTDTAVGSTAAFTEAALNLALEGAWDEGGETDVLLMTPTNKNQFNAFTSGDQAFIVGASDVFVSSFGTHRVVQHRYMRNHSVLCLDSSLWGVATLRGFESIKLAKTGDAEKRLLQAELTLRCNEWHGNSQVVGMGA